MDRASHAQSTAHRLRCLRVSCSAVELRAQGANCTGRLRRRPIWRREQYRGACYGNEMRNGRGYVSVVHCPLHLRLSNRSHPPSGDLGIARDVLSDKLRAAALLERVRSADRAGLGMDPDGTAYLDVADRAETARAAYREQIAKDEVEDAADMWRPVLVGAG